METTVAASPRAPARILRADDLQLLLDALLARGYRVVGPTVRDGAIVYDELHSAEELPIGWRDVQRPAEYRLERRDDEARFGYSVGPQSWKRELLPPRVRLWQARRRSSGEGFEIEEEPVDDRPTAFLGVKPLMDAWQAFDTCIVVDAVASGAEAGTVHRLDASAEPLPRGLFDASTHHFGLADTIELARALGHLPRRVIVYGIEGARWGAGDALSAVVEAALPRAEAAVRDEVERCTSGA